GPSIGVRIVFKRMSELVASCVGGATAHGVKLPVGREINASQSDTRSWQGRCRRPARLCATTRHIDHAGYAERTVRDTDVGITSGRVKCVRINSACIGKSPRETTRVV